jgi:D-alanyl-D-alanine carboxypeptidase/D-alanyl-D-alanine-endopeptidase (penicillin-binding protein 4)
MKRPLAAMLVALTIALATLSSEGAPKPSGGSLNADIDAIVAGQPDRWGVFVTDLDTGRVVYEHNPNALMQPASNQKVFTTAAALDALGPRWTTRTSVYATAEPRPDGVLRGDLVLYGRGDPNLSGRFSSTDDALEPMRQLAAQLRARGVTRVDGALYADESYLSGPPHGSGWAWEDLQWHFGAEVSALSFNDNLVTVHVAPGARVGDPCVVTLVPDVGYLQIDNQAVTIAGGQAKLAVHGSIDGPVVVVGGGASTRSAGWTGELAVHAPALYAAAAFRRALADAGIEIAGTTKRLDAYMVRPEEIAPDRLVELAAIDSLPLEDLVRVINKNSQNLHAELILRLLGRERGPAGLASDQAGIAVVTDFLRRAGAVEDGAVITDGCGLSRLDRVSPGMIEGVLRAMSASPVGPLFFDSLPEAGYDGTLKHRLGGVVLHAKTGSLQTAKALSGYVTSASGERLAFSIVFNNSSDTSAAIAAIDRIARALANDKTN